MVDARRLCRPIRDCAAASGAQPDDGCRHIGVVMGMRHTNAVVDGDRPQDGRPGPSERVGLCRDRAIPPIEDI